MQSVRSSFVEERLAADCGVVERRDFDELESDGIEAFLKVVVHPCQREFCYRNENR